jgi:hypothetical protein
MDPLSDVFKSYRFPFGKYPKNKESQTLYLRFFYCTM